MTSRSFSDVLASRIVRYAALALSVLILFIVLWERHGMVEDGGRPFLPSFDSYPLPFEAAHARLGDIQNSTLGFQKIFAINLPERTDHRDGLVLAGAVSNISIEIIEAVRGDTVLDKVLPSVHRSDLPAGAIGCWRSHVKALSMVIEQGLSTALIFEDDLDWDVRLKQQLKDFAVASNYLLENKGRPPSQTRFKDIRLSRGARFSPYGDGWDMLWFGHCGMDIPPESSMIIRENDDTVPEVRHIKTWDPSATTPLKNYPQHSRLIMHHKEGVCSLAYAVTQQGARNMLYQFGLQRMEGGLDILLRQYCDGVEGQAKPVCLTTLPQLFNHYRRKGLKEADSDINEEAGAIREEAFTRNIRHSVRLNMQRILAGSTDYVDQWPDS